MKLNRVPISPELQKRIGDAYKAGKAARRVAVRDSWLEITIREVGFGLLWLWCGWCLHAVWIRPR